MIPELLIFCATSLLALSAPINLKTKPFPANLRADEIVAVQEVIMPARGRRSVQYEEHAPEGPNVEDYEAHLSTEPVDSEGSGSQSLEAVHPTDDDVRDWSTSDSTTAAPSRDNKTTITATSIANSFGIPEEFIKEKLHIFEEHSKELIRLLKKLLGQIKTDTGTTTSTTITSMSPVVTAAPFPAEKVLNDNVTTTALAPAVTTWMRLIVDEENLIEVDDDKIVIDGVQYSLKALEDALIEALLVGHPIHQ